MKDKKEDILKRYYQGETTIEEERLLKLSFRQGEFPDTPTLSCQGKNRELPESLMEKIQQRIHRKAMHNLRNRWITAAGIAAMVVLILSLRSLLPQSHLGEKLQLSDNIKKERFEDALRVLGNALGEQTPPIQKVLYEDSNLIIAIE